MSQILISIAAFVVGLGILVTVHEFGHFWTARRLGVKVLRFSVGFGKPLFRYRPKNDSVEYVVAALPLGGYVKMLDEREAEVAVEERHLAFNNQSVWARIAIVSAGPLANFLLAIVLYALVFVVGITGMQPIVGDVEQGSFSDNAGFLSADKIVAVQDTPTRTWQEVRLAVIDHMLESDEIVFRVKDGEGLERTRVIQLAGEKLLKEQGDVIAKLGLKAWRPKIKPVIDQVLPGGAAEQYGLQAGDQILAADDTEISSWMGWVNYVRARPLQEIQLSVLRDNRRVEIILVPDSKEDSGETIGYIAASVKLPAESFDDGRIVVSYSLTESVVKGIVKTWDMTMLTFRMIGELIVGNASPRNISGPITIAEYAGKSVSIDLSYFIDFLAIISVSLAVLNILPIPLLDGGHLLYYLIEVIKGSPVSEKVQLMGQNIGIVVLGCLMCLAFYNDLTRIFQ